MMTVKVVQDQDLRFTGKSEDRADFTIDNNENPQGPSPKQIFLMGVASCTAMDVASILKKMRFDPDVLEIQADTTITDEHPKVFRDIHLTYRVSSSVTPEKMERAVELSMTQYCGVSAMIKKHSKVTWSIEYV